jgi:hypothetical protein
VPGVTRNSHDCFFYPPVVLNNRGLRISPNFEFPEFFRGQSLRSRDNQTLCVGGTVCDADKAAGFQWMGPRLTARASSASSDTFRLLQKWRLMNQRGQGRYIYAQTPGEKIRAWPFCSATSLLRSSQALRYVARVVSCIQHLALKYRTCGGSRVAPLAMRRSRPL